jgi:putative acetyltransferase
MQIRQECSQDSATIRALTDAAFRAATHSDQTESKIVDALRSAGALTLSLVALEDGDIVGHVAFSPVRIDGADANWHGLGPISVWPEHQHRGIGQALVREGLQRLKSIGSAGCVVLGDPKYYGRFGFEYHPGLRYREAPAGYFQHLTFGRSEPKGYVTYHPGFAAA